MAIPENIMVRFWSKVDKDGPTVAHVPGISNCWVWTGRPDHSGYGVCFVLKRIWMSHRFAWTWANGPIPDGMCVLHRCDNRPCVRPEHLFLGTRADNIADMRAKGRESRGERHKSRTHPETVTRGVRHHNALLTPRLVREARARFAAGEPVRSIARDIGVSFPTVWKAAVRQSWKHVL